MGQSDLICADAQAATQKTNTHSRSSFMRLTGLTVDGNEYLSQCSAIGATGIDQVNRNPGYVSVGGNGLMKVDRVLGTDRCQRYLLLSQASLVVPKSLELARKENAKP